MSINISKTALYVKDKKSGELKSIGLFSSGADKTLTEISEYAEEVKTNTNASILGKVEEVLEEIDSKVQESIDSIPEDYTEINNKVNNIKTEIKITNSRIDTFTSLTDGSTTGDAELMDIRVGANGKTYDSAGTAVREQISELSSEIDDYLLEKRVSKNLYNPLENEVGKYINSTGGIGNNESFTVTGFIDVENTENVVIVLNDFSFPGTADQYALYDVSKQCVGGRKSDKPIQGGATNVIEIPNGIKYLRFQFNTSHMKTDKIMVQKGTEYTGYEPFGISVVVKSSDEVIEARGGHSTLDERLLEIENKIPQALKIVEYWGDSLTQGNQDGTGVTRAKVLSNLLGNKWEVKNFGVGGEMSNTIAIRQGGMNAVVQPNITIPASKNESVEVYLKDNFNKTMNFRSCLIGSAYNAWGTVNPCYIKGVKGNLTRIGTSYSTEKWNFTRLEDGEAVVIDRPTTLVTNEDLQNKGSVCIIWIGQNNGYNNDDSYLVNQIRYMLDHYKCEKYLVIGFYCANTNRTMADALVTNSVLAKEFGRHFIDIYAYMSTKIYEGDTVVSSYGLSDNNLTPTAEDLVSVNAGKIPPSLLAPDNMHLGQYGYTVVANLEYQRGKELGYW